MGGEEAGGNGGTRETKRETGQVWRVRTLLSVPCSFIHAPMSPLPMFTLFTSSVFSALLPLLRLSHQEGISCVIEFVHVEKTIQDRKILYAWYFVYMSDRMSVTLNWDRLCVVCEKEGEVLSREEVLAYLQQGADETFRRIHYFKSFTIGGLFCFYIL